jgi:hypothetical protein
MTGILATGQHTFMSPNSFTVRWIIASTNDKGSRKREQPSKSRNPHFVAEKKKSRKKVGDSSESGE